jgi:Ni/Co efflux regulator RcnB
MEIFMPRLLVVLATAIFLLAPNAGAIAEGPVLLAQNDRTTQKVFSDLERRVIREVLGAAGVQDSGDKRGKGGKKAKGSRGGPPGLTKRGSLPPGLQRQLERNGRLPPGLEKQGFPADLRFRLPAPLQGTERLIVGNDAVLIETGTNIILDIMRDVIVNR